MKKETTDRRLQITNDLMHYIYYNIDSAINLDHLSRELGVSKFHLHKIFKEEFGSNIYETIKSIRLQKAANLLITNETSTISEISGECGYSMQTSFIRAFKNRFSMTPKQWRKGGYETYSNAILNDISSRWEDQDLVFSLKPVIKKVPAMKMYYIRHLGYNEGIEDCWKRLQAFVLLNDFIAYKQIAVYHDNPIIVPPQQCHYIACIQTNEAPDEATASFPSFTSDAGLFAEFSAQGSNSESVLKIIQRVYHEWLPRSGFKTTTAPSFAIYDENHFLNERGDFSLKYYIPVMLT